MNKPPTDFTRLLVEAKAAYNALTPNERAHHDYAQKRSFVRGMCPFNRDYTEWCKAVDQILPPQPNKEPPRE